MCCVRCCINEQQPGKDGTNSRNCVGNDKSKNDKANKAKRTGLKSIYRYHITDESNTQIIIKEAMGYDLNIDRHALANKLAPWPKSGSTIPGMYFLCSIAAKYILQD